MRTKTNPKALYVHIPFCQHICGYCDFPKVQYFEKFSKPYLKCLKREFKKKKVSPLLDTIYIGGGTPTALSDAEFKDLLEFIKPYATQVKEYTIEANPESLSDEKLDIMLANKVNRLSIGVESSDDLTLMTMGRSYSFSMVKDAVKRAKKKGFTNINLDLIIGLPHVSANQVRKDLDALLELKPTHLSIYSLTVHPNTKFALDGVKEPDPDLIRDYYDYVHKTLTRKGFIHYEVSNFALPGYESIHNQVYWKDEEYYGLGLAASGYVNSYRYTNCPSLYKYNDGKIKGIQEKIRKKQDVEYYVMLNLRTINGIDLNVFKEKFGFDLYQYNRVYLNKCIRAKHLTIKKNKLVLTYEGMMILDTIYNNLNLTFK